jgi:hypothetical protein
MKSQSQTHLNKLTSVLKLCLAKRVSGSTRRVCMLTRLANLVKNVSLTYHTGHKRDINMLSGYKRVINEMTGHKRVIA